MMGAWRWWRRGGARRGGDLAAEPTPAQIRDERLSLYLDGDLGREPREALERELAEDAEARAALEGMREVTEALRGLGAEGPGALRAPRPFTLAEPPPSPRGLGDPAARLGALAAALAAFAFVAAIGIGVGPGLEGRGGGEEMADAPAAIAPAARAPSAAQPALAEAQAAPLAADSSDEADRPEAERASAAGEAADESARREGAEDEEAARSDGVLPAGVLAPLAAASAAAAAALALGALALRRRRRRI